MPAEILRPNGTISNQFELVGAATLHEALDDVVEQPTVPDTGTDFARRTALMGATAGEVHLANPASFSDGFVTVKAWLYIITGGSAGATVTIRLRKGATELASVVAGPSGGGGAWHSVTFNGSLTVAEANDLRLRYEAANIALNSQLLYASYATFTPSVTGTATLSGGGELRAQGTRLRDSFTDTAGTELAAHTPEEGGPYTGSGAGTINITNKGRLRHEAAGVRAVYVNANLASDNMETECDVWWNGYDATHRWLFFMLRGKLGNTTGYAVVLWAYANLGHFIVLYRYVNGVPQQIGASPSLGTTPQFRHVRARIEGFRIRVYADEVLVIDFTDTAANKISGQGLRGYLFGNQVSSDSLGVEIDNYTVRRLPENYKAVSSAITVSGGGALTAVGQEGAIRTGDINGGGSLTAAGTKSTSTTVAQLGGGALTVSSSKGSSGSVAITGGGELQATSHKTAGQAIVVTGGGEGSADATKAGFGVAAISGAGALTVLAFPSRDINLRGGGSLIASGFKGSSVVLALTGAGALETVGRKASIALSVRLRGGGSLVIVANKHTVVVVALTGGGGMRVGRAYRMIPSKVPKENYGPPLDDAQSCEGNVAVIGPQVQGHEVVWCPDTDEAYWQEV